MNVSINFATTEEEIALFWTKFNVYVVEIVKYGTLGKVADAESLNWFLSDEYRKKIMELYHRKTNPLKILLVKQDKTPIGFLTYVIYLDEGGKCFVLECGIEPPYRNIGIGKKVYTLFEDLVKSEGAAYLELTASNEKNTRFWESNGFVKTDEMNDDNRYYLRKIL